MGKQDIAFDLLDLPAKDIERKVHTADIWVIIGAIVVLAAIIFPVVVTLEPPSTHQPNYYPQPGTFLYFVPLLTGMVFGLRASLFLRNWRRFRRKCAAILAMREGAAQGDERIAPLAKDQLSAVLDEPLPALPAQLGPFRRPNWSQIEFYGELSVLCLVFAVVLCVSCFLIFNDDANDTKPFVIPSLVLAIICFVAFVWVIMRLRRVGRPMTITADEDGLRWARVGLPASGVLLRWHEIRSLAILRTGMARISRQQYDYSTYIFVVDGRNVALVWYVKYGSPDADLRASDTLTHLIFARTGLPLRDLTPG